MTQTTSHQAVGERGSFLRPWPAPWLFSVLILPQGIYLGFITTVLPFLLGKASIPLDRIASTTSLLSLPWILSFLWSPLVDWWLRRRTWLVIWATVTALFLGATVLVNTTDLNLVRLFGLLGAISASLVLAACGGLIVTTLSISKQHKGAAWYEAGKLAGSALGAALLIWLAEHVSRPLRGIMAFLIIAGPALAGISITEDEPSRTAKFRERISEITAQIADLVRDPARRWSLFLVVSPVGTGAAVTLFPALARTYGVGSSGVIWINGIGGGLVLALGSLCGTLIPDGWSRGYTYVTAGVTNALAALMLLLGNRPAIYFVGVILYFGTTGLCWARFAALVVEIVGPASREASTRYALVTTLGNLPLVYMVWLDGIGSARLGMHGLLWTDACGNIIVFAATITAFLSGWKHKPGSRSA